MYRLAVCEDEEQARAALCALCGEILDGWGVEHSVAAFSSAEELEGALGAGERFDLLCLDILMEGKTGMELAKQLRGWDEDVSLLFITSSSDFLKDGYAVRPIQYLFKPVRRAELADALGIDLRLHHTPETVSIHTKTGVFSLPLRALRYIERGIGATVSPENQYSLNNALACGFTIAARREMYGGYDRYLLEKRI